MQRWLGRTALALAVPFFWQLDREEFHGDESHWTSSGQQAFHLVASLRLDDPQWRDEFYFYSQPQVGKLTIGAALALVGISGPTAVYDYDWQRLLHENRAAGRVPSAEALQAARVPGALAGWLGCLLVWALAAFTPFPAAHRVGTRPSPTRGEGEHDSAAQSFLAATGPLAAALLASHPLWLANARRAGLDTMALSLGLASALAVHQGCRATGRRRAAGWWVVAGVLVGLSAGTKYVGLLAALLGPLAALAHLATRRRWLHLMLCAGLMAPAAGAVFYVTNPALYSDPLTQLRVSVGFLADQAESMRQTLPSFQSPLWVAVEIVDRTIWPLGFPHVVDRSLPEPLSPGSYGTPIVALGAAIALLALARRRAFASLPAGPLALATGWTGLVFVLLALSVPTWWERWHVPLVPPLVLLAGMGLGVLAAPRALPWLLAAAQYASALAMLPSYLGRGFTQMATTPVGTIAHMAVLAWALLALVSLCVRLLRQRRGKERGDGS